MPATKPFIDAKEARLLGLPAETRLVSTDEMRRCIPFDDLRASDVKQKRLKNTMSIPPPVSPSHARRIERWLSAYAAIRSSRIFGVNFDVTERKHAEAALRDSETCLLVATSGAALGVFERDVKADRTVWVNDRMYEIFGRTRADGSLTRQQFLEDYLHPDDAHTFEEARQRALREGGNLHVVCRIRLRAGNALAQIHGKFELADSGEPSPIFGHGSGYHNTQGPAAGS